MSGEEKERRKAARAYEVSEARFSEETKKDDRSEIDEFLQTRKRAMIEKAKMSDLAKVIAENERDVRNMKEDGDDFRLPRRERDRDFDQPQSGGGAAAVVMAGLMKGGMDPEKAKQFLDNLDVQTVAKLSMLNASPGRGGMDSMLPLLMLGQFGSQPQVTMKDMVDIGPRFVDSASKLAEMARPPSTDQNALVGLMEKTLAQIGKEREANFENRIAELSREIEKSRGNPIQEVTSTIKLLKEEGLLGDKAGSNRELDLKIEQMRTDHDLKVTQMNLDMQKWMTEKETEGTRWSGLINMAGPALAVLSKPMEAFAKAAGEKVAQPQAPQRFVYQPPNPQTQPSPVQAQPAPVQQAQVQPQRTAYVLQCDQCKSEIQVEGPPFPETMTCPKCGHQGAFPKLGG